ncbi:MAG: hypothetical protein IT430_20685 [Phycisphaerales bacterium]|nr:hypothetical protein [Phycisphaerales bacterium]
MNQFNLGSFLVALTCLFSADAALASGGEGSIRETVTNTAASARALSSTRGSGYALCGTPAPMHLDESADGCSISPTYYVGLQSFVPGGPCGEISVTAAPIDLLWGRVHENVTDLHLPSAGADVLIRRRYAPDKITTSLFPDTSFNWSWRAHLVYSGTNQTNGLPEDIDFHRTPDRVFPYKNNDQQANIEWYPWKDTSRDYLNHTTIEYDSGNDEYVITWEPQLPWKAAFWDHDTTTELRGYLKWYYGPEGLVTVNYDGSYRPSSITIKDQGATEQYRQLDLSYVTISSTDLLSRVVVREGNGTGNIIAIVDYTYFDSTSQNPDFHDDYGTNGDLVQVKVRRRATGDAADDDPGTVTLSDEAITQYRYYANTTEPGGGAHTLKSIFRPDAYARLKDWADDNSVTDIFTIADTNAAQFASYEFEYGDPDGTDFGNVTGGAMFVVQETVRAGCGGCGSGGGSHDGAVFTFEYYDPDHSTNPNRNWPSDTVWEAVMTRPDGAAETYYVRSDGLTREHKVVKSSTTFTDRSFTIDSEGRPTAIATEAGVEWRYTYDNTANTKKFSPTKYEIKDLATSTTYELAEITYGESDREDLPTAVEYIMEEGTTSGPTINLSYTFHGSDKTRVKQVTVQYPGVAESQNGEGTTANDRATTYQTYDEKGRLVWSRDAEGRVDYYVYDDSDSNVPASRRTGLLWQHVVDINTNSPPSGVSLSGITIPYATTSGANLLTTTTRDSQGRPTKVVEPTGRITQYVYLDDEVRTHVQLNTSTGKTLVPTRVVVKNDAEGTTEIFEVDADYAFDLDVNDLPTGNDTFIEGDKVSKVVNYYNDGGGLIKRRIYHAITTTGYDETLYGYNSMGLLARVVDGELTITRYDRDPAGRVTRLWVGTDDSPTSGEWGDGQTTAPGGTDMEVARQNTYDTEGNLTTETSYADASNTRVINHLYDWKGRRTASYGESSSGEKDYYEAWEFNNLNQVTMRSRHNGYTGTGTPTPGSNSLERQIDYDDLGRTWREITYQSGFYDYSIDPSLSTPSADHIYTYTWYDRNNRPIKVQTKGGPATKYAYDSTGRAVTVYTTDAGGDAAPGATGTHGDADDVTGDIVLEQIEYVYDDGDGGLLEEVHSWQRDHDAAGTGALGTSVARPMFTHYVYDTIGRRTATVQYGAAGSGETNPTYTTSPTRSDTVLVSETVYDGSTGRAFRHIDPASIETRYFFDDAGRVIWVAENYTNFDPGTLTTIGGGTNNDEDRATKYAYNANGDIGALTAYQSSSVSEVTTYVYGVTTSGTGPSNLVSNSMLHAVIYPDSDDVAEPLGNGTDTTYDRVELAYNRQNQPIWIKDQRGVIREFEYDGLGRFLADKATTIPSGVDDAIQRIERSYGKMGWTHNITSRVGTGGAATIANQVNLAYNGFGQVIKSRQDHAAAADTDTIGVGYAYADGDLMARLTTLTYPQTSTVNYTYDTGLDSNVSRVSALTVSSADIVEYSYMGYNTPVIVDYSADPAIRLDYTLGSGSESETYKSWDRFGRVTLHNWVHTVSSTDHDVIKIAHTYDRASNRTSRDDQIALPTALTRDEVYSYDDLNRVLQNLRGTISGGSISDADETEQWTLDPLGNWTTYKFDGNGDEDFVDAEDFNDSRSYASPGGLANEITEWDPYAANSGSGPAEPTYDLAGNMTDDDYLRVYTYDAWNRLVKVQNHDVTPVTVGEYGYDGLNRRITRTIGSDDAVHEYYTESWQRIESRPGGESSTQGVSLFVFGIRYIDDIVMRQRDANVSGPPEERRYYLTDANYNVVMLVNESGYGVERVFYTAYGEPECFPFGDADGDYDVDTADQTLITSIKNGGASYNILADLNLDGAVTQADLNAFSAYSNAVGGRGVLTASNGSATTANDVGYAGYLWNDERVQWHVRNREYDPILGRWLQREPLGYVDTMNLYEYVGSSSIAETDPAGLSKGGSRNIWPSKLPTFLKQGTFDEAIRWAREHGVELTYDEMNKLKKFFRYRPRPGFISPEGLVAPATIALGVLIDRLIDSLGEFPQDDKCRNVVKGVAVGNCDMIKRFGADCCTNVAKQWALMMNCETFMEDLWRRCKKAVEECPPPVEEPQPAENDPAPPPVGPQDDPDLYWWDYWGGMQMPPEGWSPGNPLRSPSKPLIPGVVPSKWFPSPPGLAPEDPRL